MFNPKTNKKLGNFHTKYCAKFTTFISQCKRNSTIIIGYRVHVTFTKGLILYRKCSTKISIYNYRNGSEHFTKTKL